MKKWEYIIIDSIDMQKKVSLRSPSREQLEEYLTVLGSRGWEIVNIDFREFDRRGSFAGVAKREVIEQV